MKNIFLISLFVCIGLSCILRSEAQDFSPSGRRLSSKLQLAVDPGEIVLTKGIEVGSEEKKIQLIVRETSGFKTAELELVARPFIEMNSGDSVDVNIIKVELSKQHVPLKAGGLQRIELIIGGFRQAGSYLGGITIHDSISGERQEIDIRVSVKDSWHLPVAVLLIAVLAASGVNSWAGKGRKKNRFDKEISDWYRHIEQEDVEFDSYLSEAEGFLEKARAYNQDFQFLQTEDALSATAQKFRLYEQRKQGSEALRMKIQDFLGTVRDLGENDQQSLKISDQLIQLLPKIQGGYEESEAIFKQVVLFFEAYRMARRDFQHAREKLTSNLDYVKKADRSKIELIFGDIERLLNTAETMTGLDEVNLLLRKVAYELSPEKINENIFRSQRYQKALDEQREQVENVTGQQARRIVDALYGQARNALEDNRYEDVDEALQKLTKSLEIVGQIKQAEKRLKGRDAKMTELRRLIRDAKTYLEGGSWDGIQRAAYDVNQVLEILDGVRKHYEEFPSVEEQSRPAGDAETSAQSQQEAEVPPTGGEEGAQLRRLSPEDLRKNLDHLLEQALQYPRLRDKMASWRTYCEKLLQFNELREMFAYLDVIREELELYTKIQTIRAQMGERTFQSVQQLLEQAEQLILLDSYEDRAAFHRAEVLAAAASALWEEKQTVGDFEQVISTIRSPRLATKLVTGGSLSAYFAAAVALGFQSLYAPSPDFGAVLFEDYFSLVLWAFGFQGVKMTAVNVYEAYFKKER
ncbi:hypothetical protein CSB45_10510 [candidate division KSB3 bacterium]|uniref:Uncharacterized protein n=1 Tax=candidate division KSB3 bacterium TaxID=2044937 RepID=A0A2G6E3K9_9BACT|nr:MAG: hypothetical protein CSB45_10510 [candidate division KSB3 bacterium]PIE29155.1 MAG: hypothetical protein CSA57_10115 [candidate division KSB3 bacterium]